MLSDRILSLHPCAAVWCAGQYVELGVACAEIAGASVRSATEAGPVGLARFSLNSPPGGVDALPGGLFGEGEGARVACSVITDRNNTTQGSNNVGDFVQDFGAARA
jgi:hypothetical protein